MSFRCDVSWSELLYYREHEHLSNREIARRLGVSYQTVLKTIGPEPKKEVTKNEANAV